jgi:ATP/maltotriose-dependent transcriptional regulator MalT
MGVNVAEVDDPVTVGWQALARGAWDEAFVLFRAATDWDDRPEVLEGLGIAAWWRNDAAEAFRARERAYRRYREHGDHRGAARIAIWLSSDHFSRRGEHAIANGWARRARRLLEGLDPGPEHVMVAVWEGHMAIMVDHDTTGARRLCSEAAALARSLDAIDLEMLAQAIEGYARVCEGDLAEGMRLLDEATTAAVAGEMTDINAIINTCCFLIYACERVRDHDRAAQWCDRVGRLAARWSDRLGFAVCRTHYAGVLIARGDWAQAEAELGTATEDLAATHPAMAVEGIVRLAELRRRQGRLAEADALFARLDNHPLRMLGSRPALLGQAALALDRGEPNAAAEFAERYLRAIPAGDRTGRVAGLDLLVRTGIALGDHDLVGRSLRTLVTIAAEVPTPSLRGTTSLLAGMVAAATGADEDARRQFEDAADQFEQGGAPYDVACARLELAHVLGRLGRTETAAREARAAFQAFDRIGAAPQRDRAAAALHTLEAYGRIPEVTAVASTADGRTPLTQREVEVLRLVAQGRGDREIAAVLGLSEHTVHRHVSNILTKLTLPTRAAAVAYAGQRGLL